MSGWKGLTSQRCFLAVSSDTSVSTHSSKHQWLREERVEFNYKTNTDIYTVYIFNYKSNQFNYETKLETKESKHQGATQESRIFCAQTTALNITQQTHG